MEANNPQVTDTEPSEDINKKLFQSWFIFLILGILGMIGGAVMIMIPLLKPVEFLEDLTFPEIGAENNTTKHYSYLTGEEVASQDMLTAPTYCIQTPNGTDGARPQAGLNEAGVIFEAIAEAGITRFAAIYQNPSSAVIGPIRSLRLYYLQWDTPFDCTIVHAGGADDAIAAVRAGRYKDLTENYTYMYRGSYGARRWNNLFTTSAKLAQMNTDWDYGSSNVRGFKRMTPARARVERVDDSVKEKLQITKPATGDISTLTATLTSFAIRFGSAVNFNVSYNYDAKNNFYRRSYESGDTHENYKCPGGNLNEVNPEDVCELTQLTPSVVVAMVVQETKAWDGYHEDITTLGSGEAYIFQNGGVVKGSWAKGSVDEQIKFFDEAGNEVSLVPGQTIVEAVPAYGSVDY